MLLSVPVEHCGKSSGTYELCGSEMLVSIPGVYCEESVEDEACWETRLLLSISTCGNTVPSSSERGFCESLCGMAAIKR